MTLPDVPDVPQTTAGGSYPNDDCAEEDCSSLLQHFAARPGVIQATVRELEQWNAAHGDDPSDGTQLATVAACLTEHGLPSHTAEQALEVAPGHGHYSIALVRSDIHGIPTANGSLGHYVVYLGEGWYRNPATGTLTNTPDLGPAYTGQTVEVDVPAIAAPISIGDDEMDLALLTRSDGGDDPDGPGAVYLAEVARRSSGVIPIRKRHIGSPADVKPYLDAGMVVEQVHGVLLDRAEDGPIITAGVYPKEQ